MTAIVPQVWSGSGADYLGFMPLGPESERSVPRIALRERRAVVINDMHKNPHPALRVEAVKRGFHSMVALPLYEAGRPGAMLALYACEPGFFNEDEMKLLEELAGDISFALDTISKEEQLNYLAYYDSLTGTANRTLFLDRLGKQLPSTQRSASRLAVLFFDVDRFKGINDSLGRPAGDALLKELAARLSRRLRDADDLARVSADHFAVVLRDVQTEADVARVVESLLQAALEQPFELSGQALHVSAKVGVAVYPGDGDDADTLFRNAESAAQSAKQEGEKYLFYAREMSERIAGKLALENRLRLALERDEFVLHYQPKVDLRTRRIVAAEALIRWMDPEKGLVPPGHFIPLLEETGLILEVGRWALRRAVRDHHAWQVRGIAAPRVAVNVSPVQLRQRDFVEVVSEALKEGAKAPGIDLEVTESLIMQDIDANIAKLKAVRELGLGIAIDDFGTGYSSLSYLAKLPVQVLKIDRSFVMGTDDDPDARTLVAAIIDLAHSLRLEVVAEGVETEAQAGFLRGRGCDQMQGYLFSRPVAVEDFVRLITPQAGA
jgi:diguanylate cyclase (GGDEF)-like protein